MATAGARITYVTSDKWEDDWYVDGLDCQQRNLYDFLSEGNHGTFAGVFKLLPSTAKAKTNKPHWRGDKFESTVRDAFAGHVTLYAGNWWFVRAYVKHNAPENLSPKQADGIASTLRSAPVEARADWWREYGPLLEAQGWSSDRLGIPIEALSKQPFHSTPGHSNPLQGGREGPRARVARPPPRPSWQAEAKALKAIPGYPFDEAKDRALVDALAEAYPQLDLAREIRAMKAWCSANGKLPLQGQAGPRRRLRTWMAKADQFGARQQDRATRSEPERPRL